MPDRKRNPGEDPVDYAIATGRIPAKVAASYRQRLTAGQVSAAQIEMLAPGLPPVTASSPAVRAAAAAPGSEEPALTVLRGLFTGDLTVEEMYNDMYVAGTIPQMFAAGSDGGRLPLATASGIDPAALAAAPVWCRPGIAAAKTLAEATELLELAASEDGAHILRMEPQIIGPWNDFQYEVSNAARHTAAAADVRKNEAIRVEAARRQREVTASAIPVDQLTYDQLYDSLFASSDQRRAADKARRDRGHHVG